MLAECLHSSNWKYLKLGGNLIGREGIEALADALRDHKTLEHLELWGNPIENKELKALAVALESNEVLTYLDMQDISPHIEEDYLMQISRVLARNRERVKLNHETPTATVTVTEEKPSLAPSMQFAAMKDMILPKIKSLKTLLEKKEAPNDEKKEEKRAVAENGHSGVLLDTEKKEGLEALVRRLIEGMFFQIV